MLPIMHLLIRGMYDLTRLAIYMKARHAFPMSIPIMDGSGYPLATKQFILKSLEDAKNWVRNEAKKEPLKMFIMTPDPHGTGGSSDNGNTARKFFSQKWRQDVLKLFPTATPQG